MLPDRPLNNRDLCEFLTRWLADNYPTLATSVRHVGLFESQDFSRPLINLPFVFVAEPLPPVRSGRDEEPSPDEEVVQTPPRHGPGFRSAFWNGHTYPFSEPQSLAIMILWQAWEANTPDVPDALLLRAAGSTSGRLSDVFRGCEAWGTLIVEGETRGTHRLAPQLS